MIRNNRQEFINCYRLPFLESDNWIKAWLLALVKLFWTRMSKSLLSLFFVLLAIEWSRAYHYNNYPHSDYWKKYQGIQMGAVHLTWLDMKHDPSTRIGGRLDQSWFIHGPLLCFRKKYESFLRTAVKSSYPQDLAYGYKCSFRDRAIECAHEH